MVPSYLLTILYQRAHSHFFLGGGGGGGLFHNLQISGHRCYEFLQLWCWNVVPFLPDKGFQLLVIFDILFRLMMRQIFSVGERSGLQADQFSTRTLLIGSHAVVIAAVCGLALSSRNTQGLPWNRHHVEGSTCCSKTFVYLSAFIVPSKTCKLPLPYAPCPLRRDFYSFLNLLMMLCTVDDEICKAFAIWRWGTLFLKYSTIFECTLSQIGESLPIFIFERAALRNPFDS